MNIKKCKTGQAGDTHVDVRDPTNTDYKDWGFNTWGNESN